MAIVQVNGNEGELIVAQRDGNAAGRINIQDGPGESDTIGFSGAQGDAIRMVLRAAVLTALDATLQCGGEEWGMELSGFSVDSATDPEVIAIALLDDEGDVMQSADLTDEAATTMADALELV